METAIEDKEQNAHTPEGTAWFRARIPEPMLININILNARRRPEAFSETIRILLEKGFEQLNHNGNNILKKES